MNEYHFNTEAAQRYGVNEAIFIHSLAFWVEKNRSNRKHFHDGRYWSYDTYKAMAERFPFWTARQIERIIANCKDKGAILVANYNTDKTDRTQWYALTDAVASIYSPKTVECKSPNGEMVEPQRIDGTPKDCAPITPNGEMQITKRCHPSHQTVKCIKGNSYLPDNKPPISPKGEGSVDLFERFWVAYPYKEGKKPKKQNARRAWEKLKPSLDLCRIMAQALERDKQSEQWIKDNGRYIPHASTWLNERRWEDEIAKPSLGTTSHPTVPRKSRVEVRDGEEVVVFV